MHQEALTANRSSFISSQVFNFCLLSLTLIQIASAFAQPKPKSIDSPSAVSPTPETPTLSQPNGTLPWDPEVRRGTLANKMRYLIEANQHPEKRAELRLVVNAGSVLEDEDQLGLAHFVEHMAFNGSTHFKGNELVNTLESFGMKFGAHLNAYTSFDETVYQLQIPTEPEQLKVALQIMRDWAGGISFDPTEIEKERGVVLDEWRRRLGAQQRIQDKLIPLQFNQSRYASRLPIGTEASLKGFKPEQLKRFYHDWYRPELMTLIIVGDIDVDQMEAQVKALFSDLKTRAQPRARSTFEIKPYQEPISRVFVDPELPSIALQISALHAHREPTTRAGYRLNYIRDLATRILNERLGELRKQAKPPFMYAIAYQSPLTAHMESRGLMVVPFEGQLKMGVDAAVLELKRAQRYGVTQSELDRIQRVMLSYLDQLIKEERTEQSEGAAAELVRHATRGEPVPGLDAEAALMHEIAPTVSVGEVNRALNDLLGESSWCATLMGPTQSAAWLPDDAGLDEMVRAAFKREAQEAYRDETTDAPLVSQPPVAGQVVQERIEGSIGATIWELSNGVRVILKPTDFEDNTLLMSGFKWGGLSTVSDADEVPASQALSLAMSSGLGAWSATTLPKRLAGTQASLSVGLTELSITVSGASTPKDLDTMFELLWLRATESRIDDEVFETSLRAQREELSRRDLSPMTEFYDTYQRLMWDDHPRRQPLSQAVIERADLKRSRELLTHFTGDWSGATFIFVGKLDLNELKPKIERWLGGLPGKPLAKGDALPGYRDVGAHLTRGQHQEVVRRGIEPKAQVIMSLHGDFINAPLNRYELRSLTQILSTRLREVIREREGGTYSVGANSEIIERPKPEYSITISFGCDPERVEELTALAKREVVKLIEAPPLKDEVSKVKAIQQRSHEVNIKRNEYWLGALASNFSRDEPPTALLDYWKLHTRLSPKQVHAAAKRYLSAAPNIQLTLLPRSDAKGASSTEPSTSTPAQR